MTQAYFLVIIEDRDGSENYWGYVIQGETPPLIWRCLMDDNVKYLLRSPRTEEENDFYHENFDGYTNEEISYIWSWFHNKSPYGSENGKKWTSLSLAAPFGGIFIGVRHMEENPYPFS